MRHVACDTLHAMWHVACCIWHVACCILHAMWHVACHVPCCVLCQMHKQTAHPIESSLAVGIAGLRHDVVQPKYAPFAERAVRHVKVLGHARCSDCRIRLLRAL